VGECIQLEQQEHKEPWSDARQAALERLYLRDGRADPCHPMHGSYTGLEAKFFGWNVVVAALLLQNSLTGTTV
jgi:hypothetical protein